MKGEIDEPKTSAMELALVPQSHDIGGLVVRRALPTAHKRSVGPFVFADHMGPVAPGAALVEIKPHPHIGIATLTYLFEGALYHRDTTGAEQIIEAGDVGWMTAGRGIVHSERAVEGGAFELHGMQFGIALPKEGQDVEPSFAHFPRGELPLIERPGARLRVTVGAVFGVRSPVTTASPTLLVDIEMVAGAPLLIEADVAEERALYLSIGRLEVEGEPFEAPYFIVLHPGVKAQLNALSDVRGLLLGGAPLPERRHMDWNFVWTDRAHIEQAKDDYRAGRLGSLPEDGENLPLPEDTRRE